MSYYLIEADDKGQTTIREIDPVKFAEELNAGDYGEMDFVDELPRRRSEEHSELNFAYNGGTTMLIKGKIIVPKKVEITTRYAIE